MVDKKKVKKAVIIFLKAIGENVERDGLKETPKRVANMCDEIFSGNFIENKPSIKTFKNKSYGFIIVENIPVYSICEHHLLPFFGCIKIGYIPRSEKIVGISKFERIVNFFAKRLQIQERITQEVAEFIFKKLPVDVVIVESKCQHLCISMRGVKSENSKVTSFFIKKRKSCDEKKIKLLSKCFKEDKNEFV